MATDIVAGTALGLTGDGSDSSSGIGRGEDNAAEITFSGGPKGAEVVAEQEQGLLLEWCPGGGLLKSIRSAEQRMDTGWMVCRPRWMKRIGICRLKRTH